MFRLAFVLCVASLFDCPKIIYGQGQDGQSEVRQCWNKSHEMAKTPYFIGNGFTCCNNLLIDHPIKPKNEHWRKCMNKELTSPEDDIPTSLWNVYMCELSSASNGSFTKDSLTYKHFQGFFLRNHPATSKQSIMNKSINCEVPSNASLGMKLKKYETCFIQSEEEACFNLAGVKLPRMEKNVQTRMCEPVESLKKPNHAFEIFAQPCCKGKELPYPLFDVLMDFDRFDIAKNVVTCSENLKSKLTSLKFSSGSDDPFTMCQVACVHEMDGLKGKYNTNFQELVNFKLKSVSNSTKKELMGIISKYKPMFQMYGNESGMPMDQAGEAIAKLDEAGQIINYCKFQYEATAEVYRALYETCYNAEYGNQFREDIMKSSKRNNKN